MSLPFEILNGYCNIYALRLLLETIEFTSRSFG